MTAASESIVEKNGASYKYDSMGEYKNVVFSDKHKQPSVEAMSENDVKNYRDIDFTDGGTIRNEHVLLLPNGGNIEADEEDPDEIRAQAQRHLDYRHQNRFIILGLVSLTPIGVKFFKAAQSSFEGYLMNDPLILMSATTYSLSLSLMSLPVVTLLGGAMLDYKAKQENQTKQQSHHRSCIQKFFRITISSEQSCLGTSRTPSNSAILFLGISLFGIIIYGYGLEMLNSIPVGLAGATIFGLGEGCVVVASRTFVAHAFYGSDGAFAQGVLVAMNNIAMMASKISLPWLIENEKKVRYCIQNITLDCLDDDNFLIDPHSIENDNNNIWIGVLVCCMVQLISLFAGIIYAWKFGLAPLPQRLQTQSSHEDGRPSHSKKKAFLFSDSSLYSRATACFEKLPVTFWIVAVGRAIFVVVFKVFTRNSNAFLMEKFGVSAVAAGIKSSFHELFALGSPVVGYLAYRSPGGIVPVLLFAAALGSVSIATLACVPADVLQLYLPGGAVVPLIGISIAHGIFIPICMAIIPQTCSPDQTGMAFAVVEVLGSILNVTNILFGWLRDTTGNFEASMEMLLLYTLVGTLLLWISRNHIEFKPPNEQ